MKKIIGATACTLTVFSLLAVGFAAGSGKESKGEQLFRKHCAQCHPDGGNIIKLDKTLRGEALEKNRLKTEEDIIKLMRNPGPGMVKFGESVISEKDARAIAVYILKTFK
ncbi:MAG TPA: c-type cytochrome [Desulfatiglandales bacterium]|nr:c-type cytochrome [Desulfatiglandales bacterium]